MKIETKFNIGQEVYIIMPYTNDWGGTTKIINIVEKFEIEGIEIKTSKGTTQVMYWLRNRGKENEEFMFATKEEAEAKLKEVQDDRKE
mgnify:CR=1 FL=1